MQISSIDTYSNQISQPITKIKSRKNCYKERDKVFFGANCNFTAKFDKYITKWLKKNKFSRNEWNDKIENKEIIEKLKNEIIESAKKVKDIDTIEIDRDSRIGIKNLFNRPFILRSTSAGNSYNNVANSYEIEIPVSDPITVLNQVILQIESINKDFSKIPGMDTILNKIDQMVTEPDHSEEFLKIVTSFKNMIDKKEK